MLWSETAAARACAASCADPSQSLNNSRVRSCKTMWLQRLLRITLAKIVVFAKSQADLRQKVSAGAAVR